MASGATLVAGATGALGTRVCELLLARGGRVRALVRPGSDAAHLEGVELVEGDLERPETLPAALDGIAGVVVTATSFPVDPRPDAIERVDRHGVSALVAAAVTAGVKHVTYVSFRPIDRAFPLQDAKRAVERQLVASGLDYTVLRPGSFMEIWFSPLLGFDLDGGNVQLFGSGTAKLTWISSHDVAAYAVWSLEAAAARNATIELGGPAALSQLEVVAIYEQFCGRPLATRGVPLDVLEAQLDEGRSAVDRSLAGVMLGVAAGGVTEMAALAALSGIEPTSVRQFVERSRPR